MEVFDETTSVPDIITENSIRQVLDVPGQDHRILVTRESVQASSVLHPITEK